MRLEFWQELRRELWNDLSKILRSAGTRRTRTTIIREGALMVGSAKMKLWRIRMMNEIAQLCSETNRQSYLGLHGQGIASLLGPIARSYLKTWIVG